MNDREDKIVQFPKFQHINLGLIIFGFIFVYIIIMVFLSFADKKISGYVVTEGSLSTNTVYRGIALRDEHCILMDQAGYVNFYVKEGDRVAVGDLVYTVDETGKLADLYGSDDANIALSDEDLYNLKSELVRFSHTFDATNFISAYEFKNTMSNTVLKLSGNTLLNDIDNISAKEGVVINKKFAPISGIVSYWTDGYEDITEGLLDKDKVNGKNYNKNFIVDNDLLKTEDTAYKICTSDVWYIYIPYDYEEGSKIVEEEEGYVRIKFIKNQYESWGKISMIRTESDDSFMKIELNNSMVSFANDRFLDIELLINDDVGLKVPNKSIVEKQFYLVPEEYMTTAGDGEPGVLRQTYLEDGSVSTEFIKSPIYKNDEETGEVYLETDVLRGGDVLIKPESMEQFIVGKMGSLIGVYNINKGYADFKRIEILYQNDEYSIVKSNTMYGLTVYDYIVLDASTVSDDEILYE